MRSDLIRRSDDTGQVVIEAWHPSLEFELRRLEHFTTKAAARGKVAAWIEDYDPTRRHLALGMRSPVAGPG
jgi:putative transposase